MDHEVESVRLYSLRHVACWLMILCCRAFYRTANLVEKTITNTLDNQRFSKSLSVGRARDIRKDSSVNRALDTHLLNSRDDLQHEGTLGRFYGEDLDSAVVVTVKSKHFGLG